MAESTSSFSFLLLVFLIFFLLVSPSPSTSETLTNRGLSAIQTKAKRGKSNRILKCCEIRTRSHCSVNPRCRWCRSNVLDDSCFSKAEARRLPNQVFLCDS